jgi:hypothetical protein
MPITEDDEQTAKKTVEEIGEGIADGAQEVGEAIERDADQTKEDVKDVLTGGTHS